MCEKYEYDAMPEIEAFINNQHFQHILRAPKDLALAHVGVCKNLFIQLHFYKQVVRLIADPLDYIDIILFCRALHDIASVVKSNLTADPGEFKKAYFRVCEYITAVADDGCIDFCDRYYCNWYDVAYTNSSIYYVLDEIVDFVPDRDCFIELWKKCELNPSDGIRTADFNSKPESKEYYEAVKNYNKDIITKYRPLYEHFKLAGMFCASPIEAGEMHRRFSVSLAQLKPSIEKAQVQFCKAWKTLPWGEEKTLQESLPNETKTKKAGRPPKYLGIAPMFNEGRGKKWSDIDEFYAYLIDENDPAILNHKGNVIRKDSFKRGLDRALNKYYEERGHHENDWDKIAE